ncbi:glucuronate isomerase [Anaerosinus massiliensis]|uniref:glucuronate isomerase n=1 Tax=Massilibacillus massiliensis TaxID=1806837 RepID=UPI000B108641|nr:glucuronate isomerase [Massilibacillus massiliensis]
MKSFMDENFLLGNETAKTLFHDYAKQMPILDYHCHINPEQIAKNHTFSSITEAWLSGDHYKWRMIRSNGIAEAYITGKESSDWEKFQKFAQTMPKAIGNPLYHWTHLELKRYFDCDLTLSETTAEEIWQICNQKLRLPALSVCGIIQQSNVAVIGTTDDPIDDLKWHKQIRAEHACSAKVIPSFRPDKAIRIEKPEFKNYIKKLAMVSGIHISSIDTLYQALEKRIAYFDELGCRASDHALEYVFYRESTKEELNQIFQDALNGKELTVAAIERYKTALLLFFGKQYKKYQWVMQIHYSALRDGNTKEYLVQGPDTGFDCIASYNCGEGIVRLLDALNQTEELPKTVLYSLNPNDNAMLGSILGNFQSGEIPGKIQHGSAWWFNDTKKGIEEQLTSLANLSVLGNFIGMLTDSRSFLSYTRHEYFRRILCNLLGTWVENGEYPNDIKQLGQIVQDISYYNACRYFNLNVK